MSLATLSRPEFLAKFDFYPGESIGLFGATGSGKTMLGNQLANRALESNPGRLRYVIFQPKPDDSSTISAAAELGLRIEREYPFRKRLLSAAPRGHVFWPPHRTDDAEADIEQTSAAMKKALNSEYWRGGVLAFIDDAFLIESRFKAAAEAEQFLIAGRSSGAGIMFAMQAPKGSVRAGVSSFHYSQPTHLFFAREGVAANRQRYGEISMGIDPRFIEQVVGSLKTWHVGESNISQWLYLDRRGPYAAIVNPW